MSALHLIFNQEGLTSCKRLKAEQDKMILLGDAVYCAPTMSLAGEISQFHILKDDWEDDLTISAFDPSVIGSTSRFVHKYRSPN